MQKILCRQINKVFPSSEAATLDIKHGATLLIGGFGVCGVPENLLRAINTHKVSNLVIYTNLSGTNTYGPGLLVSARQVTNFHASYIGANEELERQYLHGEIELELIPQGTLIERFRAGSHGIHAFYTPTGANTLVETGGFPMKYFPDGKGVEKYSQPKPVKEDRGRKYLLEEAIQGDVGIIKAWKADPHGNLVYRKSARNSNSDIAGASKLTIAEVEEIVPVGTLDPDEIHTPGILVDRVVKGEKYLKPFGVLTLNKGGEVVVPGDAEQVKKKITIAKRAAKEIKDGMYVNLGIGIPTLTPNFIEKGVRIVIHSENGVMGVGPYPELGAEDPDLTNAGKETITMIKGASTFASSTSFGIIRGSHLDLTILGGLQVSQSGDLASWAVPGKLVKGMGGSMDLVSSNTQAIVCMEHTSKGLLKVVENCSLPLTGSSIVKMLITELGVFEFRSNAMELTEIGTGVTIDHIRAVSSAKFQIASGLKPMNL